MGKNTQRLNKKGYITILAITILILSGCAKNDRFSSKDSKACYKCGLEDSYKRILETLDKGDAMWNALSTGFANAVASYSTNEKGYLGAISSELVKGHTVFLYLYTQRIPESKSEIELFEQEIRRANNKSRLIVIDVEKTKQMQETFAPQYAPSIFVLRPGEGIVHAFVVDVEASEVQKFTKRESIILSVGHKSIADSIHTGQPTLLFFNTWWCAFSNQMRPEIDKFKKEYEGLINVISINVDNETEVADAYIVNGVPCVVILDRFGIPVKRIVNIDDLKKLNKTLQNIYRNKIKQSKPVKSGS